MARVGWWGLAWEDGELAGGAKTVPGPPPVGAPHPVRAAANALPCRTVGKTCDSDLTARTALAKRPCSFLPLARHRRTPKKTGVSSLRDKGGIKERDKGVGDKRFAFVTDPFFRPTGQLAPEHRADALAVFRPWRKRNRYERKPYCSVSRKFAAGRQCWQKSGRAQSRQESGSVSGAVENHVSRQARSSLRGSIFPRHRTALL
jgi:hypothetical protein